MNTRFYITEDIQFLVYLLFLYTVSHSIVYFCGPPNSNFTIVMVSNTGIYLETIKLIVFTFYSEMSEYWGFILLVLLQMIFDAMNIYHLA
jgi:hypothetical protein